MQTVGILCRLTLVTRRLGGEVIVDDIAPDLLELLDLAGVGAAVTVGG